MKIKIEEKNKVVLIRLFGELDHHSAVDAKKEVEDFIERKGNFNIIFDLAGLEFMDSSGVGLLVGRHKLVEPMGGKVSVISGGSAIDRILKMSGIEKIIGVYKNESSALAAANGGEKNEN